MERGHESITFIRTSLDHVLKLFSHTLVKFQDQLNGVLGGMAAARTDIEHVHIRMAVVQNQMVYTPRS